MSNTTNAVSAEIDATNQYIATQWRQLNRNVDMFFSNQGYLATENQSSILVYSSFYKKEGMAVQPQYDFQFKFDLPHTTKKLKIIIEKEQDEISKAISDDAISNNKTISSDGKIIDKKNSQYSAGVNFLLNQSKLFVSNIHFGIRLDMPLNPFTKINVQKDFEFKSVNIELSQKFIMYRQEGFQEISQLSFNKKLSNTIQVDLINSVVWSDASDVFILRNNFILYQQLADEKGLSYSIGANARFSPSFYYESYDASVSYRQLLYNKWLYGTLTLGADFSKANHFDDEKFIQVRIDVFFKG